MSTREKKYLVLSNIQEFPKDFVAKLCGKKSSGNVDNTAPLYRNDPSLPDQYYFIKNFL